jgi:hypothetical protein
MTRRGSSARAAALRRAQEAKAARDAERLQREKLIEVALADFYEAGASAARIRDEARRKAGKTLADAEKAAGQPRAAAREAIRRLRELVGGNAEVASLCGLTVGAVREMLTVTRPGEAHASRVPGGGAAEAGGPAPSQDGAARSAGSPGGIDDAHPVPGSAGEHHAW